MSEEKKQVKLCKVCINELEEHNPYVVDIDIIKVDTKEECDNYTEKGVFVNLEDESDEEKYYCNKCDKGMYYDEMNELEQEELDNNNAFVCSSCINDEMNELDEDVKKGLM